MITSGATSVAGEALPFPVKATVMGPARVIPREFPEITCSTLDIETPTRRNVDELWWPRSSGRDLCRTRQAMTAALRGPRRYEQTWQPARLELRNALRGSEKNAVVLMTGGLGGIGMTLAERLVRDHGARIAFVSRTPLPAPREHGSETLRGVRCAPANRMARQIRALMALEAAGGTFKVLAADVVEPRRPWQRAPWPR